MSTVHIFIHEPIFTDRTPVYAQQLRKDRVGSLSDVGLSYFKSIETIADQRPTRTPAPTFNYTERASFVIDGVHYADFIATLQQAPLDEKNALYSMVDHLFFRYAASDSDATLDVALTQMYPTYIPGTLDRSANTVTAIAYLPDGGQTLVTAPAYLTISVWMTVGNRQERQEIRFWLSDTSWREEFPLSHVLAVIPPLPIDVTLAGSLLDNGPNRFSQAADIVARMSAISAPIARDKDTSGELIYTAKVFNTAGDSALLPFSILYKGRIPDRLQARTAIREYLLNSGIGIEAQWRQRIPELFIDGLIYLVPMWDNITTRPDQSLYPSVISGSQALQTTRDALSFLSGEHIAQTFEVMVTAYNQMTLVGVSHPDNDTVLRVRAIHPTYQAVSTLDPAYQLMEIDTQTFAQRLAIALSVAARVQVVAGYDIIAVGRLEFVPFTVGMVEYYVMSRESYLNSTGGM